MCIFRAPHDVGAAVGADPDIDAAEAERAEGRRVDMQLAAEHVAIEGDPFREVAAWHADMREGPELSRPGHAVLCLRLGLRSFHGILPSRGLFPQGNHSTV